MAIVIGGAVTECWISISATLRGGNPVASSTVSVSLSGGSATLYTPSMLGYLPSLPERTKCGCLPTMAGCWAAQPATIAAAAQRTMRNMCFSSPGMREGILYDWRDERRNHGDSGARRRGARHRRDPGDLREPRAPGARVLRGSAARSG